MDPFSSPINLLAMLILIGLFGRVIDRAMESFIDGVDRLAQRVAALFSPLGRWLLRSPFTAIVAALSGDYDAAMARRQASDPQSSARE